MARTVRLDTPAGGQPSRKNVAVANDLTQCRPAHGRRRPPPR